MEIFPDFGGTVKPVQNDRSKLDKTKILMTNGTLTHISLASFLWEIAANSADPDHMPQNAASDQGLHCLLTECSFEI